MLVAMLQFDWESLQPDRLFGGQVLERTPAGLSIAFLIGMFILTVFLFLAYFGNFRRSLLNFEIGLPRSVFRRLSSTATNRSLKIWRAVFILLAITVYGYHVYWTYYADAYNDRFQALSYKDLRYRRTTAANLRGWMFDRSGDLSKALAYYSVADNGEVVRTYSLNKEMAHLLGTERGTPGLERTLYQKNSDPMPESWEVLTSIKQRDESKRDVKVTIDSELQAFLAEKLKGRKGAIVVLNPQTGDVLGIYSNPTFDVSKAQGIDEWLRLEANARDKPLLNRALREYYVPGSTFKTFTMIAAFRTNKERSIFVAKPEGFTASRSGRPIRDYGGSCSRCGPLGINDAYQYSSNQYFAQLAISIGKNGISDLAKLTGIRPVEKPADATNADFYPRIWNSSNDKIANAIAPRQSTIVTGKDVTQYDIGLEGIGQGYSGQMTPLQMALIASVPANLQGKLMKPKIEYDQSPVAYAQVVTPREAAQMRQIMSLVPKAGTARGAFAKVNAAGIRTGGKTGSAEKQAPVYDEKTGKLRTRTVKRRNSEGILEDFKVPVMYLRTDSWYLSVAPIDNPQIVIAVVVEAGGGGSRTAAPIAAEIVFKAQRLGLIGGSGKKQ